MSVAELERARAGFGRGDWVAAFEAWSASDVDALSIVDLDDFATAAELIGRHDETVALLQRAFGRGLEIGDLRRAVRCAFRLAMTTAAHGEPALSAGWTSRAEGLLEEIGDAAEVGWVAFLRMLRALGQGAFVEAATCADEVTAAGRRHHDPDLVAMGICSQGRMALYAGRVADGLALLDEAMVRVIAGETSPIVAGHVYCTAIEGCQEISDFPRVAEWTAALERWCADQPGLLAFTGQCAVHRGQLLRLRGEWEPALAELELACRRYQEVDSPDAAGLALYEAAELRRLRGEHEAAEEAYQQAADHGFDPQPGLALLWLARDQPTAARSAVQRVLGEVHGPVQRCRLLPGAVEVLLGCGDLDAAHEAAGELGRLAAGYGSVGLEAAAAHAAGAVELASGDPGGALPYLRKAQQLWARADNPYDRARVRVLMGTALAAVGDEQSSRRELEAARSAFRQLGASPDADETSRLLAPASLPSGLTAREAEVLRLVATGRSNSQIAADLVLSEKTVARHLSNIFGKLDVGSRTAATAYAFEHGLV
jgi:DNA-binding CsgD family transcriptional regulator/tetratricopeptide (TPR) repeat protein